MLKNFKAKPVTVTLRIKPLLLAGVASLALTHAVTGLSWADATDATITGRLDNAPASTIKAPDTLMAIEVEEEWLAEQADDTPAPVVEVDVESLNTNNNDIPSRLPQISSAVTGVIVDPSENNTTVFAAPGALDFVPAAKPVVSATSNVHSAYNAAEAMAAALADTTGRLGPKLAVDQVATLPEQADDETAEIEVEVETVTTPETDETVDDERLETIEIFSGDMPVKENVIVLPPVPSAKPAGSETMPKASNTSELMQNSVADNSGASFDFVLGAVNAESLTPVQVAEFAQTPKTRNGDLAEIIALAITNHPQVLGSQAEFRASEEAVREERSNLFPTLSLEGFTGYRNTDNRATRGRTTRGADGRSDVSAWASEGTLRLNQLIYDFGTTYNTIDAARSRLGESQFVEADSQEQIGLRAVEAYLFVQQTEANQGFAEQNVAFHIETLDDVTQRANAGAGDEGDVRQTESRLALAREFLLGFEEAAEIAKADFIEAVGEAPGNLAPVSVPTEPVPETVADALTIAIEENPFITAATFAADSLAHETDAAFGAFYPRFDLDVSYTRGDDVSGIGGKDEETRALVRMVWDLPTGGGEYATRRRLENLQEAAEQEQEERIRLIEEEVRSSYAEVQKTTLQVEQLEIRVESADGVVDAYQQQFGAGRRTLLDLLDSENERFLARVALNNGQTELIRAHYRLFTAMGRLRHVLGLPNELADTPLR